MNERTKNSRRDFIKNASLLAFMLGVSPISLFSKNSLQISDEEWNEINTMTQNLNLYSKQYLNYKMSSSLSLGELHSQYNGLLKINSEASNENFKKLTNNNKIKKLNSLDAFTTSSTIKTEDSVLFYDSVRQARDVIATSVAASAIIYEGAVILSKAPPLYTLGLPPIISIPLFIGSLGMTAWNVYDLYGNQERNKKEMTVGIITAIETVNNNVYKKFFNSNDYNFEKELKGLQFNISGKNIDSNNVFNSIWSNSSKSEKDLLSFIKSEISNSVNFSTEKGFKVFLDKYIEKIGEVQKHSIDELITAQKNNNQQEILLQRDKAALYQSINSFVGNAIHQFAAEKEAKILNELINAGFAFISRKFMTPEGLISGGGMTSYGWAAVGINIASTLAFGTKGGGFERAIFKMLAQIQKQLNIIIEKIDILYQNQIEILKELHNILNEVIKTQNLINQRFQDLSSMSNRIYHIEYIILN